MMSDELLNGDGTGEFKTFMGAGFGTMLVRLSPGTKPTPQVASSRAYLRGGLPAVYQESDFQTPCRRKRWSRQLCSRSQ